MLLMRQTASFISTYAADVSGICSALYELGGMTVMHDASGCNSTYNTHDEARWYDMDSLVYISALSEMEAIMGDDEKLINDIISAAEQLSPSFIAIAGTPIPMMTGTDIPAIASVIEHKTGIPAFGFPTNGMHSYLSGISMAFEMLVKRIVEKNVVKKGKQAVNIIGATPLDFSINGSVNSMKNLLEDNGFDVISNWAMGSSLDEIKKAGEASVNLVVSYSGLRAARELHKLFSTPYVVGTPTGKAFSRQLLLDLRWAAETGQSKVSYTERIVSDMPDVAIIGESVMSGSLAAELSTELGKAVQVLCPLETDKKLLAKYDYGTQDEDDIIPHLKKSKILIADPLYRPICPEECRFVPLPHEAFSGRTFRKEIPDLVKGSLNI
ncbi:MAG: nitrogenase component 1 [Clostridiaceae bacterium]